MPRQGIYPNRWGLSIEESNVIQRANAYHLQLKGKVEPITPMKTSDSIETLCKRIRDLTPIVLPQDATQVFLEAYKDDEDMCRVYNYFNREMAEILKHPLTEGDSKPESSGPTGISLSGSFGSSSGRSEVDQLNQLALAEYKDPVKRLDALALAKYKDPVQAFDALALAAYKDPVKELDRLAMAEFKKAELAKAELAKAELRKATPEFKSDGSDN